MTYRKFSDKSINDRGFSLIELIICIAILAIATIPLLSAFTTSGRVIGKAQSMQNATSVAEAYMEEIKASTIQQIREHSGYGYQSDPTLVYSAFMADTFDRVGYGQGKLGANSAVLVQKGEEPFYVFYKPDVKSDADETSTGGEYFDVVVTLDATENYVGAEGDTAIDANSIKLPVIDRIDKGKHAAISKEINRLDCSAAETWTNNWRDKNHKTLSDNPTDLKLKKEVVITINDPVHDTDKSKHKTDVECTVRYFDASKSKFEDDEFHVSEKVYSGTFLGTSDTRVYLFYKTARQSIHANNKKNGLSNDINVIDHEDVIITSTSVDPRDAKDPRKVFFILQEEETAEYKTGDSNYFMLGAGGTTMTIKASDGTNTRTISSNSSLTEDGVIEVPESGTDKSLLIITNLPQNMGGRQAFYNKEKDDYIYAIDVFVYDKDKNEKAHLSSTKDAQLVSSPTPTPSVTPP